MKLSSLKVLNQEPTIEVSPEINEKPEVVAAAVTEHVDGCIKEATILTIFENYGIFLIRDQGKSVSEALSEIEKIISVVYERGDVSVTALKHINEYLNNYKVDTKLRLEAKEKSEFCGHVLVAEMGELLKTHNVDADGAAEFTEIYALEQKLNMAKHTVISKYKSYVDIYCAEFLASYKRLFHYNFLARFE